MGLEGGREHGQKADQLPGYRYIDDPEARAHIAKIWDVQPDSLPGKGRSAYELLDALGTDNGPRALLVFGSNVLVASPQSNAIGKRLRDLDLLVVCDSFVNETAELAHVILPVAQWAEEVGTVTNLEGRVILRRRVSAPPPSVKTDIDVLCALATRCSRRFIGVVAWPPTSSPIRRSIRSVARGSCATATRSRKKQ